MKLLFSILSTIGFAVVCVIAQSNVWLADNGDGTYKNPIIHADYSDPDAIRVGSDFYMTASSFNAIPGLPILHSKDLVNWKLVNHALKRQPPFDVFDKPQHGGGVWAPSIRFHNGEFYIYYGDPDFGVYMVKTKDPLGDWSEPFLVKSAKGWIDTCPFWDEDGKAYLVHAFAGSRAGIKTILVINRMSPDGTKLLDDGVLVFDGHDADSTVEGPKIHKRNGFYYIFTPAGGVSSGWQLVLRSKNIYGPYEKKIVLSQGKTAVNGPHQGAWVDTLSGEDWFIHFQDKFAYGRVVHLQPMKWLNDFPVMGDKGEPVLTFRKPRIIGKAVVTSPAESDEFDSEKLGLQWQWHANPKAEWAFPFPSKGILQMFSVQTSESFKNLWDLPNLLLQKFPAEKFTATAKVTINPRFDGEKFGFVVMGLDYSYLGIVNKGGKLFISQTTAKDADKGTKETETEAIPIDSKDLFIRLNVSEGANCRFSISTDNKNFQSIGTDFKAREGKWIGSKFGFFFNRPGKFNDAGTAEIDWLRIEK